jgi:hypothetical protein
VVIVFLSYDRGAALLTLASLGERSVAKPFALG